MKKRIATPYNPYKKSSPIAAFIIGCGLIEAPKEEMDSVIKFIVAQLDEVNGSADTKEVATLLKKVLPYISDEKQAWVVWQAMWGRKDAQDLYLSTGKTWPLFSLENVDNEEPRIVLKDVLARISYEEQALVLWDSMMSREDKKDIYKDTQALWPIFPVKDVQSLLGYDKKEFLKALKLFLKNTDRRGELDLRGLDLEGLTDADIPNDLKRVRLVLDNVQNVPTQLISVALKTCRDELWLGKLDLGLLKNADIPDDLGHMEKLRLNGVTNLPIKLEAEIEKRSRLTGLRRS